VGDEVIVEQSTLVNVMAVVVVVVVMVRVV